VKRLLLHPHVGLLMRLVVGAVFVYASADKIRHPDLFARSVLDYHFLPASLVVPFALVVPWAEAVSGLFLLLGWLRRGSAAVILALLAAFMVAISAALARDIDIACGCFHATGEGERLAWVTLGRDLLLLAGALIVFLAPRTTWEPARPRRAS